jgi:hypothetical protein
VGDVGLISTITALLMRGSLIHISIATLPPLSSDKKLGKYSEFLGELTSLFVVNRDDLRNFI